MTEIDHDGLRARLAGEGSQLRVELSGQAEADNKPKLDRFFEAVHDRAATAGCSSIEVDLKTLQFMSSSCFKSFVTWIRLVQQLAPTARYQIDFAYNPNIRWQRASLSALSCFSAETVKMHT